MRANDLLSSVKSGQSRAALSGMLIGLELAAARPYWLGQAVVLIGAPKMVALYRTALSHLGAMVLPDTTHDVTLHGLQAAYAIYKDAQT